MVLCINGLVGGCGFMMSVCVGINRGLLLCVWSVTRIILVLLLACISGHVCFQTMPVCMADSLAECVCGNVVCINCVQGVVRLHRGRNYI